MDRQRPRSAVGREIQPAAAGKDPHSELRDALEQLETCLETPFIPGELERWFSQLTETREKVDVLVRPLFERSHKAQLEQIFQQDPGLEHRVEQVRRQDREALDRFDRFVAKSRHLAAAVPQIEPDEARLKDACHALVDEGLAAVIAIRKQEIALRTWLVEAFERDRGIVD